MCGRTATTRSSGEIAQACTYRSKNNTICTPQWSSSTGSGCYKPSYNNGPKSYAPILMKNQQKRNIQQEQEVNSIVNDCGDERVLSTMQWGLVPSWHKGDPKDFNFNMINCRSDTLLEKKSFEKAFAKGQRCVVLADGFYEWHTDQNKEKQPYYIQPKQQKITEDELNNGTDSPSTEHIKPMLHMAGLFDCQVSEEQGELYTFTVITVDASSTFSWLHHRMPAILDTDEAVERWLNVGEVQGVDALQLLVPTTDALQWYPVSSHVNNVRNNTDQCVKKIDLERERARKMKSSNLMSAWLSGNKAEKRKSEDGEGAKSKRAK